MPSEHLPRPSSIATPFHTRPGRRPCNRCTFRIQVLKDEAATLKDIQIAGTGFMVVMVKVSGMPATVWSCLDTTSCASWSWTGLCTCCSRRLRRQLQRSLLRQPAPLRCADSVPLLSAAMSVRRQYSQHSETHTVCECSLLQHQRWHPRRRPRLPRLPPLSALRRMSLLSLQSGDCPTLGLRS